MYQKFIYTIEKPRKRKSFVFFVVLAFAILLFGCDNMRDGSKLKPLEKSDFFEDGSSSRPQIEGTVARGYLQEDDHLYRGMIDGKMADAFPFEISEEVLRRGEERYNIFCSVCHDEVGTGNGTVVRRGFKQPPSFHDERLREAPDGYFFKVITEGFGSMSSYAGEIKPEDRWAIIAYIRALQLSQNTPYNLLSSEEKKKLDHV